MKKFALICMCGAAVLSIGSFGSTNGSDDEAGHEPPKTGRRKSLGEVTDGTGEAPPIGKAEDGTGEAPPAPPSIAELPKDARPPNHLAEMVPSAWRPGLKWYARVFVEYASICCLGYLFWRYRRALSNRLRGMASLGWGLEKQNLDACEKRASKCEQEVAELTSHLQELGDFFNVSVSPKNLVSIIKDRFEAQTIRIDELNEMLSTCSSAE
jgi:hypothetical protein